ncbi:MAG: hypothetical protein ACLFVE_15900 [Chitinispirillaceae bacterium]
MHLLKIISNYYVIHKTRMNLSDVPEVGDQIIVSGNRYKVVRTKRTYDFDQRPYEVSSIDLHVEKK